MQLLLALTHSLEWDSLQLPSTAVNERVSPSRTLSVSGRDSDHI